LLNKEEQQMPFKKGQSGNPSGRPRRLPVAVDAILKAREYSAEMLNVMVEATRNLRVPVDRRAAIAFDVWCIGQGRPMQSTATHLTHEAGDSLSKWLLSVRQGRREAIYATGSGTYLALEQDKAKSS
jgi:Family of unknown function (DUF5681)